jgi:hypothetical protein
MPMRRIRSGCPRAASGHAAAAPPSRVMNPGREADEHNEVWRELSESHPRFQ